jgi:hypothetical protein
MRWMDGFEDMAISGLGGYNSFNIFAVFPVGTRPECLISMRCVKLAYLVSEKELLIDSKTKFG